MRNSPVFVTSGGTLFQIVFAIVYNMHVVVGVVFVVVAIYLTQSQKKVITNNAIYILGRKQGFFTFFLYILPHVNALQT